MASSHRTGKTIFVPDRQPGLLSTTMTVDASVRLPSMPSNVRLTFSRLRKPRKRSSSVTVRMVGGLGARRVSPPGRTVRGPPPRPCGESCAEKRSALECLAEDGPVAVLCILRRWAPGDGFVPEEGGAGRPVPSTPASEADARWPGWCMRGSSSSSSEWSYAAYRCDDPGARVCPGHWGWVCFGSWCGGEKDCLRPVRNRPANPKEGSAFAAAWNLAEVDDANEAE